MSVIDDFHTSEIEKTIDAGLVTDTEYVMSLQTACTDVSCRNSVTKLSEFVISTSGPQSIPSFIQLLGHKIIAGDTDAMRYVLCNELCS